VQVFPNSRQFPLDGLTQMSHGRGSDTIPGLDAARVGACATRKRQGIITLGDHAVSAA
jgi:hypothetical protein